MTISISVIEHTGPVLNELTHTSSYFLRPMTAETLLYGGANGLYINWSAARVDATTHRWYMELVVTGHDGARASHFVHLTRKETIDGIDWGVTCAHSELRAIIDAIGHLMAQRVTVIAELRV